jgi:hypothetical protein
MLGLVWWAMAEAIGNSFTSLQAQTTFGLATYPGVAIYPSVAMVVLSGYWLSRVIVDRDATLRPAITALLFVEPIAMTLASATNGWHHLVFASTRLMGDPGLMVPQVGSVFCCTARTAMPCWAGDSSGCSRRGARRPGCTGGS